VPAISLPILTLSLHEQRYSCHGCGNCCRDFTVQLREADLRKLREQNWDMKMGGPVTIEFRGVQYLRQREDGACVFLMEDGLCRIHKEFGFAAKPIACQLFPFHITPGAGGLVQGLNFACQSVLENKGAELRTHGRELSRMAGELEELKLTLAPPPILAQRLWARKAEERSLIEHVDEWLQGDAVDLPVRLDGLAWVAQSLARANFEKVRDDRFEDLLDVLFGALPDELEHHPIGPATGRQSKLLRQAVFARTEDPKLSTIAQQGRVRITLGQLSRNRRFKSGRGPAPVIGQGWKSANLAQVSDVAPARDDPHAAAIEDLMTRWLRATVLGGRAWGAGYYGWSMVDGLQALLLNAACVGWLARLHAAGEERSSLQIEDVRAALGRVDRTAGRAKWLGSPAERLRLAYLNADDGLRRVLAENTTVLRIEQASTLE
jgi:lysine-N-methylase